MAAAAATAIPVGAEETGLVERGAPEGMVGGLTGFGIPFKTDTGGGNTFGIRFKTETGGGATFGIRFNG